MSNPPPARPNLEQLKNQAKDLLKSHKSGESVAIERIRDNHPDWSRRSASEVRAANLSLSDAQVVIAREHGFPSWAKLKQHVESVAHTAAPMEELAAAVLRRYGVRDDRDSEKKSSAA